MRAEKQILTKEYAARLNASPFFIVVGYQGLKVAHLTELRKRLTQAGAEIHVVKNSIFRIAAKEAGVAELNGSLAGQMAVVTGQEGHLRRGQGAEKFRGRIRQAESQVRLLEQPAARRSRRSSPWRICRASTCCAPSCLACSTPRPPSWSTLINTPATQLAQVIKAKAEKAEQ